MAERTKLLGGGNSSIARQARVLAITDLILILLLSVGVLVGYGLWISNNQQDAINARNALLQQIGLLSNQVADLMMIQVNYTTTILQNETFDWITTRDCCWFHLQNQKFTSRSTQFYHFGAGRTYYALFVATYVFSSI